MQTIVSLFEARTFQVRYIQKWQVR